METKEKKKEGLSRLFEIAGQKKGLLFLAGLLSAGSAVCMLVPYWAVYEVLKELLTHGTSPGFGGRSRHDSLGLDRLLRAYRRTGAAVRRPDVLARGCIPHSVRIACPAVRAYRQAVAGLSQQHLYRSHQEDDGAEHRENRGIHRPHDSRFGERSGDGRGDARHLFLAGYMADGGLSGRGAVELRPAILQFHGEEGTGVHEYLL